MSDSNKNTKKEIKKQEFKLVVPNFNNLSIYKAKQPLPLTGGFIGFSDETHAKRFNACLEETSKKGVFLIIKPFQLKAGLVFGFSGDLPKSTAAILDSMDVDAVREKEKV